MSRTDEKKLQLCRDAVRRVGLDLTKYNILTELGSNQFAFLPIIATMANAKSVIALVRDTKYGTADDVEAAFNEFVTKNKFNNSIIVRKNLLRLDDIKNANIVTNSHMLRPIGRKFISNLSPSSSVISLMYEAWELRGSDIDLDACTQFGIRVCGVSETNKILPIFQFCGPMIAKLVFEAGFEIMNNKIVILSKDAFGDQARKTFLALGASNVFVTDDLISNSNILKDADFLLLADYNQTGPIFGPKSTASLDYLNECNPNLGIIQLFGEIREHDVSLLKERLYPSTQGSAQVMQRNLSYCGDTPVFWLQTAGLKAAEEILSGSAQQFSQTIS